MNVVITGASKGIGLAIAERLLETGNIEKLAICSRSRAEIDAAHSRVVSAFPEVTVLAEQCDVSQEDDVKRFSDRVLREFGQVDVLVNNAGFGRFGTVDELATSEWNDVIATNLRGVFLVTSAFLSAMRARKHGTIVTIGSLAGKQGFSGGAAYCAAKFGVRGLMQSLFLEVRSDNIRVVTLFPGSVDTAFFDALSSGPSMANKALHTSDVAESVLTAILLPHHATISELDIRPTNPKG